MPVGFNATLTIARHAERLQTQPFRMRPPPDCHEHAVGAQ